MSPRLVASRLPLLSLLIAVTCLSQFYRVSNSVIAPELTRDLGLSPRQLGWAGSAFFFALFAVQIPVGMWFDRFGARLTEGFSERFLSAVPPYWIRNRFEPYFLGYRRRRCRRRNCWPLGAGEFAAGVQIPESREGDDWVVATTSSAFGRSGQTAVAT